MKKTLLLISVLSGIVAYAQTTTANVGINTQSPKATLHIEPGTSEQKGVIIPRVTAKQMIVMTNNIGTAQNGMISYLTETMPKTNRTGKLEDVSEEGYYYYSDALDKWVSFVSKQDIQDLKLVGTGNHITQDANIAEGHGVSINGKNNIAIGENTLNFTGNKNENNITIGKDISLRGSNNIFLGEGNATNGAGEVEGNIIIGKGNTVAGGDNVVIGTIGKIVSGKIQSGGSITGYDNIVIGNKAGAWMEGIGGNVHIGNGNISGKGIIAIGNGFDVLNGRLKDNTILLGDESGRTSVGIGVFKPVTKLEVNGGIKVGQDLDEADISNCTSDKEGTLSYLVNGKSKLAHAQGISGVAKSNLYLCDGGQWRNIAIIID